MFTIEQACAHASGDCAIDCAHPDHLWDNVTPDLDWLMFGELLGREMQEALAPQGFVEL